MTEDGSDGERRYHHGNLRQALLDAAAAVLAEAGIGALSLREVARRAGVSHAAPAHHFATKAGLLTALATDGFDRFADALAAAPDFEGVGLAYVRFAADNPAVFELMFRPEVLDRTDADLLAASGRAYQLLIDGSSKQAASTGVDVHALAVTAWSVVHGFATLWLHGNFGNQPTDDPTEMARLALHTAFPKFG